MHDVGRRQPGAQDDARLFQQAGVQRVFVHPDRIGRLLQAERAAFERAAQAAVGLVMHEVLPVRAGEGEKFVQRQRVRRYGAHLTAQHG